MDGASRRRAASDLRREEQGACDGVEARPVTRNPFPEVTTVEELGDVWAADYVQCSGCIDLIPMSGGFDPVQWATEHRRKYPHHVGFRTHSITNFSVPADESATSP
ncbi:hypothetical protein [Streptomyces rishiriensis]|uniref:hypothetical protein n=1 Tax=Streptomyces rishiriensis TaxID=68264 RepID=UPI0037D2BC25